MQAELHRVVEREHVTALLVTHDIDESLILSDRILLMASDPGRIARTITVQLPRPRDRNSRDFIALRAEIEDILSTRLN
jgi:sulfonate transport system ATP-binding protein